MSHTECHLCGAATGDSAYACAPCAGTLATALHQIHGSGRLHGLDVDLDIATARQAVWGEGTTGANPKGSAPALLIDPRASEAASVLRSTLTTWVRVLHHDHGATLPANTLAAMARWLRAYTGWIRHAPYGPEMIDEITAAVRQAQRAVDRPTRRVPLHRPCRAITLDGDTPTPCQGELVAILAPGLPTDGQVRCTSGQAEHTTTIAALTDRRRGARLPSLRPT